MATRKRKRSKSEEEKKRRKLKKSVPETSKKTKPKKLKKHKKPKSKPVKKPAKPVKKPRPKMSDAERKRRKNERAKAKRKAIREAKAKLKRRGKLDKLLRYYRGRGLSDDQIIEAISRRVKRESSEIERERIRLPPKKRTRDALMEAQEAKSQLFADACEKVVIDGIRPFTTMMSVDDDFYTVDGQAACEVSSGIAQLGYASVAQRIILELSTQVNQVARLLQPDFYFSFVLRRPAREKEDITDHTLIDNRHFGNIRVYWTVGNAAFPNQIAAASQIESDSIKKGRRRAQLIILRWSWNAAGHRPDWL